MALGKDKTMRSREVSISLFRKLFFALIVCLVTSSAAADQIKTEYMAIYYGQTKIGYTQTTRRVQDKKVRYEIMIVMNLGSGITGWKIETNETSDGAPLSFTKENLDGSAKIDVRFRKGQMEVKHGSDPSVAGEIKPIPKGVVLLEGDDLLMKKKGLAEGASYSFTSMDFTSATALAVSIHVGPVKDVPILGKIEKLHEVIRQDGEIRSVNYMDDDCNVRKCNLDLMGLELEMVECDRELALSANFPPDLQTLRTLQLPSDISNYRDATAMEIVLVPDGKTHIDLPVTGAQDVTRRSDGSFVVTVRAIEARRNVAFPYRGNDAKVIKALQPSATYECQNPQLVETARGAIDGCSDADLACKKLELFVRSFIVYKVKSSDDTAMAILQHQRGTCREHAILMVALCRALGIPARMVSGLAYNGQNQLSGHAWVQCYIGDRWTDYDAALDGFDVAHVALWTDSQNDYGDLLSKYGHLTVANVKLELPWYRRLFWPVAVGGVLCVWLFLRRRRKMKLPRQMRNPSQAPL